MHRSILETATFILDLFSAHVRIGVPLSETLVLLAMVSSKGTPLNLTDLAQKASVNRRTIRPHMDKLVTGGLAEKSGRKYQLSPKGCKLAKARLKRLRHELTANGNDALAVILDAEIYRRK